MIRPLLSSALLAASFAFASTAATDAATGVSVTPTATLTTTINVLSVCYFTTPSYTPMYNYDPINANQVNATTPVAVPLAFQCTANNTTYGFTFAASTKNGGSTGRQAVNGANLISYGIYSDSGATTLIPAGSEYHPATPTATTGVLGNPITSTVYVASPGGQTTVPAGTYTDTITITISPT